MYKFNAKHATEQCINWIKDWFEQNGKGCNAVLGISGGKDSSVVAALCTKALGNDRVIGVLMPKGEQFDIDYSIELCDFLNIKYFTVNIAEAVESIYKAIGNSFEVTNQTRFNLPPRIRMSVVYAVAQSNNGRVANTCNLSEDWVGYSTRYGDSVGDFSPLSCFTVAEVKAIGRELGLPEKFVEKPPIDGLCGKTDEDNLGFTYATLDAYIREGIEPDADIKNTIDTMHRNNLFKLSYMPCFSYDPEK
ncbi:MAG: NAD(+) synthase [Oscillospiraceae bacterium]|nr:NAD(+) synthase [Oscillospiraceae bacterium]